MTNLNSIRRNLEKANLPIPEYVPLAERTGKLPCTLQNDYLFKAVMQTDESALRSLLCSLLRLKPEDISSVHIENPIDIGSSIVGKTIILDVKVLLNNSRIINLEMQRFNQSDWPERSLFYLCRTFSSLESGESYTDILPAHHIGILDFPLRHLPDEFYASYYIMNSKSYKIYSDKLCLSVLNLSHIHLATEEDKLFRLDQWAALFKAETWEDIKMLTTKNPDFESIAEAMHFLTENRNLVDAYIRYNAEEAYKKKLQNLIAEKEQTLREQDLALLEKNHALQEKDRALQEKNHALLEKDHALLEKDHALQKQSTRIAELEKTVAELKHASSSKP